MFIGVDPHKLSATIEVVDDRGAVLVTGRFGTDKAGYSAMRKRVAAWPDRTWAVEGSNGAGRPLAQRLLADGERVVDVPAKLSARARLLDTGHNRKTDAHDAHAVAVVAVRTPGLRVLAYDVELEALRMLVDHRHELARQRIQTVNRLQRLLSELTPGKAKRDHHHIAGQGNPVVGPPPRRRGQDAAPARRRAAGGAGRGGQEGQGPHPRAQGDGVASGSTLMELPGVGPVVAARTLADVGDVSRFANRNRFASC
jgi:transposase